MDRQTKVSAVEKTADSDSGAMILIFCEMMLGVIEYTLL